MTVPNTPVVTQNTDANALGHDEPDLAEVVAVDPDELPLIVLPDGRSARVRSKKRQPAKGVRTLDHITLEYEEVLPFIRGAQANGLRSVCINVTYADDATYTGEESDVIARLSEQREHTDSNERQVRDCLDRSEKDSRRVRRVWVDNDLSGAKKDANKRPAYRGLHRAVLRNEVRFIYVWKLDRLFRHLVYGMSFMQECKDHDALLVSVMEPEYSMDTPTGELLLAVQFMIAQYESKNTGIRVKSKMDELVLAGHWTGAAPLGYQVVRVVGDAHSTLAVHEPFAECIRAGVAGIVGEGKSSSYVVEILTRAGLRQPGGFPYPIGNIRRLLRSPRLMGYRMWNTTGTKDRDLKNIDADDWKGLLSHGVAMSRDGKEKLRPFPAIIDDITWWKLQEALDAYRERSGGRSAPREFRHDTHWLVGVLTHSVCGHNLHVHKRTKTGTSLQCSFQRTEASAGLRTGERSCPGCVVQAEPVGRWVKEAMRQRMTPELLVQMLAEERKDEEGLAGKTDADFELERAEADRDRVKRLIALGAYEGPEGEVQLAADMREVNDRIAASRKRVAAKGARPKAPRLEEAADFDVWWDSLDNDGLRAALLSQVHRIEVAGALKKGRAIADVTAALLEAVSGDDFITSRQLVAVGAEHGSDRWVVQRTLRRLAKEGAVERGPVLYEAATRRNITTWRGVPGTTFGNYEASVLDRLHFVWRTD